MSVREIGDLKPEAAAAVEEYLARVEAGLCEVRTALAVETVAETRAHFLESLDASATPHDVAAVAAELGEPDEYAAALCAEISGDRPRDDSEPERRIILGMPYEFRPPTAERVRSRMWNPADPRVMVPRVFGIGWSLNFGALAVRAGLIRPDDEDEPFASVPESWQWAALAVPVLITLGMAVTWWLSADTLPAQVPVHWGISGQPDDFSSAASALGGLMALAGVPTLWALWTFLRRMDGTRAIVSAFASLFAALAALIFATTLWWAYGEAPGWFLPVGIIGALAVPFALLVTLARVNRREEWNRDLGSPAGRSTRERNE